MSTAAAKTAVTNSEHPRTSSRPTVVLATSRPPMDSILAPADSDVKPRPYVTVARGGDADWDPVVLEQYTRPKAGSLVRSGDSYAVVRPGWERWPLGHVSDVYKPTSHRRTVAAVRSACSESVRLHGDAVMSGHGYRVAHSFDVLGEKESKVGGLPFVQRLAVIHDHSGLHATKARIVCFVGDDPVGSLVGSRAIHVAENPGAWKEEVDDMLARARSIRPHLLEVLKAAADSKLGAIQRKRLEARGIRPTRSRWEEDVLGSALAYFRGGADRMTWGIYERRFGPEAIQAIADAVGGKRSKDLAKSVKAAG